jgi:signal transduction histidine kinase
MDEAELTQVFERFYKGKKGNTGLGMTITKAIIEKHKGSIEAANRPDGGAKFTVMLPLA